MSDKRRIEIYDTTLRDGTQAQGVALTLEDKLQVARLLDTLGVDYIEGGYPLSNPKDEGFFREVAKLDLAHAKVAAFGMTRRRDTAAEADAGMQALLASEAPVVTLVGKSWDMHVAEVLRVEEDENLRMIADSVDLLTNVGRQVVYDAEHFFDGYAANEEFALRTLTAAVDAGATHLSLCDTNGGSTLGQIARVVRRVVERFPKVCVAIHCHNDADLAVANSLMAVRHGARQVQGTINGIGERCGNADLVSVIGNLALKYDYDVLRPGTLKRLAETSRLVYEIANLNLREHQPFVGAAAFAHKGGMHVHAVQRNARTYEHMDPELVGNTRRVLMSELAGMSNIAANTPAKFGIAEDRDAQRKVLRRLVELEAEGYQFEAAEASYEILVRKVLGGAWHHRLWNLDHYRCVIFRHNAQEAMTEAIVKLRVDERTAHTVAEGDGPVDSLYRALRAAVREDYTCVNDLHLADYKVRVVNISAETAAKVRVVIDWHDEATGKYFGSVGVSENIIDASWRALVDAVEYKVLTELEKDDLNAGG